MAKPKARLERKDVAASGQGPGTAARHWPGASSAGASMVLSWALAGVGSRAREMPFASTRTCRFVPGLPRSAGFGPIPQKKVILCRQAP